jgi:site-specific DNA-cytosine methylase
MYIFAGGFTLGVKKHFDVLCHLEGNDYGVATMNRNQPEIPVFHEPERWPVETIKREYPEIDFLYGNPPCAAWSPIGAVIQFGSGQWEHDDRVDCVRTQFNALEYFRPKVWAWESVPQAYTRGWSLVKSLTARAFKLGYCVSYVLHNSQYVYGKQHRKRFFFVAHRIAIDWTCPFVEPIPMGKVLREHDRLSKKARGKNDVTPKTNIPDAYYHATRPGESFRGSWDRYTKGGTVNLKTCRQSFAAKRGHHEKVSPAIIGPRIHHPTKPRHLTTSECLHICGYPTDYDFGDQKPGAAQSEIARAVMPPVGAWLAENVARAVKRNEPVDGEMKAHEVNFFSPPGQIIDRTEDI